MERIPVKAAADGGVLHRSREVELRVEGRPSARLGSYLRHLREGYGFTLRKVEERATAMGEAIDNSQLSRFEKGKAVPSFEKLRALARIFSVSVQTFSDVLDLEAFEAFKPVGLGYDALLSAGRDLFHAGEHGRAFVAYERALEVAREDEADPASAERQAEARWRMATALKALGKLSMTERELREILKLGPKAGWKARARALLELASAEREMGERYLASVLARECLSLAEANDDPQAQAAALSTLGNVHFDDGEVDRALRYYQQALALVERIPDQEKLRLTALTNLGGCLVEARRFDEGLSRLREAHAKACALGFRRVAALSMLRIGEAFLKRGDHRLAYDSFAASDALASRAEESYHDILFLTTFRRWEMARREGNPTREKIAFGRLRHLRSVIERKFPEVEEFDRHVERIRRSHDLET